MTTQGPAMVVGVVAGASEVAKLSAFLLRSRSALLLRNRSALLLHNRSVLLLCSRSGYLHLEDEGKGEVKMKIKVK